MTNATATAPVRATRARAQAPQAPSASVAPVEAPQQAADWRDLVRNAIINIHDLLVSAMDAGCGGLPQELAHVADDTLSALREAPNEHEDWENFLATHHALNRSRVILSAAIYAEMDSMANEPSQLVQQSCLLDAALSWVTSTMDAVEQLPSSLEVLRSVSLAQDPRALERSPSRQPLAPPQKPTVPAHRELLNGFNKEQVKIVTEVIAGKSRTLELALMELGERAYLEGSSGLSTSIEMAIAMTSQIGMLADNVAGGSIFGDMHYWMCGPAFGQQGKAVQS